jgi:hypothetical protein
MIIDKVVNVKIGSKNLIHFTKLNYNCNVGDAIEVNPTDLMHSSKVLINVKCDICGEEKQIEYRSYIKNTSKYPEYCCNTSCAKIKENKTKKEIYGDNYEHMRVSNMKKTNKERYGNENTSQIFRNEKNKDVFINELKEIYKEDNFDYSKINYINNYTKVEIICKEHGSFKIRPTELLEGYGCRKCKIIKNKNKNFEKHIEKSNIIHNNKYDYSKVIFNTVTDKITIICPIHGEFKQTLHDHKKGRGCKKCGCITLRLKKIELIKNNLENGYQITPGFNKKACELFDKISKEKNIHIQHAMNGGEYYIKELGYWLDGYDIENNIAYEYDEKAHFIKGQLKDKDINRQKEIKKLLKCKFIRIKD